jgi:hypothetical protein
MKAQPEGQLALGQARFWKLEQCQAGESPPTAGTPVDSRKTALRGPGGWNP